MRRLDRRKNSDDNYHTVGVLALVLGILIVPFIIWIGVAGATTSSRVDTQQMQITSLQMQVLELAMAGDGNVTKTLRQSGTFQWAGYLQWPSTLCQPTTANYSVYDIVLSDTLTFVALEFDTMPLSLANGPSCSNDGSVIDMVLTNFNSPIPVEVQYLSFTTTTVPMTPATVATYVAQCADVGCVIGPTSSAPFNGYKGYGIVLSQPTFGFQYAAATGTMLPLFFNPGRVMKILLLSS